MFFDVRSSICFVITHLEIIVKLVPQLTIFQCYRQVRHVGTDISKNPTADQNWVTFSGASVDARHSIELTWSFGSQVYTSAVEAILPETSKYEEKIMCIIWPVFSSLLFIIHIFSLIDSRSHSISYFYFLIPANHRHNYRLFAMTKYLRVLTITLL